jgi:hypothetical protein
MRSILVFVMIAFATSVHAHDAPSGWSLRALLLQRRQRDRRLPDDPAKSVAVTPGGYRVTLMPGDHRSSPMPMSSAADDARR